ncbi:EpsG family protein [Marinomonas sp. CT5]|uniref:EpsG family protein n=1 Tax=Marinomonas sp. CT5 TaxID=2066133 RepID=UPI001BAEB134|nr:EpsG family protein [Marinomonas sp. CT5]
MLNDIIDVKKWILDRRVVCFFILAPVATIISAYLSLDARVYQSIFSSYSSTPWNNLWFEVRGYEAFFLILAKLLNGWPSIVWFGLIAAISVCLKLALIEKGSRHFYLSLLIYLSYFFVLQDGTGIRVSLAIAIAFWGAFLLSKGRWILAFYIIVCAALFFHYSLALFLIVFFFSNKKITYLLVFSWPLLIFMWWLGGDFITVLNNFLSDVEGGGVVFSKLKSYASQYYETSAPYSSQFIFLYFLSIVVFLRFRKELNLFEVICFNCIFFSIFVLGLLVGAGGLQNRVSEIFRFGLVFVFPLYYRYCLELVYKPWIANLITAGFLIGYFYYYVLRAGLIIWPENWGQF